MSGPRPVRVVGVGSPQGDDAVAWEVVRELQQRLGGRSDVECHLVAGGQRLLDMLDGRGTLLLVDAVTAGGAPGTVHRFQWPDSRVEVLRPGSTHTLRPAEALELATALGVLPARVVIFGIEGANAGPEIELSPAVAAAVPELVRRLSTEIGPPSVEDGGPHA